MARFIVGADRLLLIYALVVGWLCLYVPWRGAGRYGEDLGYWFVWNPPNRPASIDLTRLLLELAGATAALVALAVGRDWQRQRRLKSKPTPAREPFWPRWGSGEWGNLLVMFVVALGLVVIVLIIDGITRLFSGGR